VTFDTDGDLIGILFDGVGHFQDDDENDLVYDTDYELEDENDDVASA
jgi:hypothetical protein